jgi:hypothetical protein
VRLWVSYSETDEILDDDSNVDRSRNFRQLDMIVQYRLTGRWSLRSQYRHFRQDRLNGSIETDNNLFILSLDYNGLRK